MEIESCSLIAPLDSPNAFMIKLVSRAFAMFKMLDSGEDAGTRCKMFHESLKIESGDTHLVFSFATLLPGLNMALI